MNQETLLRDVLEGVITEFRTWFHFGDERQRKLLIQSLQDCANVIDAEMPNLEEED